MVFMVSNLVLRWPTLYFSMGFFRAKMVQQSRVFSTHETQKFNLDVDDIEYPMALMKRTVCHMVVSVNGGFPPEFKSF